MSKQTKVIILLALLLTIPLFARPKEKIRNLTESEIVDVSDFMDNEISEDPNWLISIENSKDFKGTNIRCAPQMEDLKAFRDKVKANNVTCLQRVEGKYAEVTATMADVWVVTRFDRWYNVDPNYLEAILMKERSPLDGHLFEDDFGGVE